IDQQREAGGMALREAVLAEALDLVEAALGEVVLVAALEHPPDEPLAKAGDGAGLAEGGERAAELVRLVRREAGSDDGDAHGLLLEERHAQRLAQHLAQLLGGELDRLLP